MFIAQLNFIGAEMDGEILYPDEPLDFNIGSVIGGGKFPTHYRITRIEGAIAYLEPVKTEVKK